jgi:DNA-binding NtrC family response regulator
LTANRGAAPKHDTILVVDGEVLVRHAISDYLRDCGYIVVEAANSDEAATVLGEAGPQVDAILCDAQIGGSFNGFELRQWVQQHRPELQFILSGTIASAANAAAELCEQGPQLARPYEPQSVVDYIKRLLAKRAESGA